MTLDETINTYEAKAKNLEHDIEYYTIQNEKEWLKECEDDCKKSATEYRQLADWLKELRAYREAYEIIQKLPIKYPDVLGITKCIDIFENCFEEVNADGEKEA